MRGVIVVHAVIERTLHKRWVALWENDVRDRSGEFYAGDRAYVVMRTKDGSPLVMGTGTTSLDAGACRERKDQAPRQDEGPGGFGDNAVVIREQDMALRWTTGS